MAIRVLLVDDSAVIRGLMNKALSGDADIIVMGSAANGEIAVSMVKHEAPDIIILDIEMPVMDGIVALPLLLKAAPGCKIIMASTLTQRNAEISMTALTLGASDYLAKPSVKFGKDVEDFYRDLKAKIKALAPHRISKETRAFVENSPMPTVVAPKQEALPEPLAKAIERIDKAAALKPTMQTPVATPAPAPVVLMPSHESLSKIGIKALAIASSTGGPQALLSLFEQLSGRLQNIPIFITQHMPPNFTAILAEHITKAGKRTCVEAKDGMFVDAGKAYVAPGDFHMVAKKDGMQVVLNTNQDAQENFCRPAADPMLRSLSAIYGKHLLVAVLTGMGQDGLQGSKVVVQNGGHIIAQDEASCVVYGMPKAVVENQLCKAVLPLSEMGSFLFRNIEGRP